MGNERLKPEKTLSRRPLMLGCVLATVLVACVTAAILIPRVLKGARTGLSEVQSHVLGTPAATRQEESDDSFSGEQAEDELQPFASTTTGSGRIVFVSPGGRLGTIDPSGAELRYLGDSIARAFLFPAWSPQGSNIAALAVGDNGGGVYVLTDGPDDQLEELYYSRTAAPIYLYWRPDGEAVTYITSGESSLNLFLSPVADEGAPQLVAQGQPLYWDWLDNQSRLLIHTGSPLGGPQSQVATVETKGDAPLHVEEVQPGFFQAPSVSVNSAYMAYAGLEDGNRWVIVQDILSGEQQRERHDGAVAMGWSPVDQKLAFISADERRPDTGFGYFGPLRLFEAETGAVETLVDDTVLAFFWSPDGQSIAYFTASDRAKDHVAGLDAMHLGRHVGKLRQQQDRVYLKLSIVHVQSGHSRPIFDFQPTEIFLTQFLPFFDQYALSHRLWSPDSQELSLPVVDGERPRIHVVPIDGRAIRPIADGIIAFWTH